jgi:hypothetical protein
MQKSSQHPAVVGRTRRWPASIALVVGMLALAGCVSLSPRPPDTPVSKAAALLEELDESVARAGVREAASWPLPGFPFLRSDRFLSVLGDLLPDTAAEEAWLEALRRLDREARSREIDNLPATSVDQIAAAWGRPLDRAALQREALAAADLLLQQSRLRPGFFAAARAVAKVPDEHSSLRRAVGLYPLAALPVLYLTHRSRQHFQQWFDMPLESLPRLGHLATYAPAAEVLFDAAATANLIRDSRRNPLGVPWLSPADLNALAAALAPVLQIDQAGDYDLPGRIVWREGRVTVDTGAATVYYYLSHAFWRGEPVLQLNYVFWFIARSGPQAPLIERGDLDSLTLRITLDGQGRPILIDGMNSCGCYHFAAPGPALRPLPRPWALDPFIAQPMPAEFPHARLAVRLNSGWHQVQRLRTATPETTAHAYRLVPYEVLESLPMAQGGHASIFDERGVAKDSRRWEYLLLFSMGVPDVGSMRQRGNHPIELVGSAHFDDPLLIEQRFVPATP